MPNAGQVIHLIERNLRAMRSDDASKWNIGLTSDPDGTEAQMEYPAFWRVWTAESLAEAREAKAFYVAKGMKDNGERGRHPIHVYLY